MRPSLDIVFSRIFRHMHVESEWKKCGIARVFATLRAPKSVLASFRECSRCTIYSFASVFVWILFALFLFKRKYFIQIVHVRLTVTTFPDFRSIRTDVFSCFCSPPVVGDNSLGGACNSRY